MWRRQSGHLAELRQRIEAAGFTVAGRDPNELLADVLRWEVTKGRLRRVSRGRYAIGHLPEATASRVRHRWRRSLSTGSPAPPGGPADSSSNGTERHPGEADGADERARFVV